jgi:isoleucyl-tRNA synthetase
VHFTSFPEAAEFARDAALEGEVTAVRQVVALGLGLRERERIGVRRPLASLTIVRDRDADLAAFRDPAARADLLGELNVKELALSTDDTALVELSAKANFKTLGKKLGGKMKAVAAAVQALGQEPLRRFVKEGRLEIEGETLGPDDVVLVRAPKPGLVVASEGGLTVVLDTTPTEALRLEGLAREIVNRVQNLRKTADLDVSQRIVVTLRCGGALAEAASRPELAELIRGETLATDLRIVPPGMSLPAEHVLEDSVDDEPLAVTLTPA